MDTETERIVAVLHDIVEDSDCEPAAIKDEFGREVRAAVVVLTKRDGDDYLDDFIPRAADNDIARKVKRADLKDNMGLTRLSEVTDEDITQQAKYHAALQKL